jgi:hypothetical protein
MCSDTFAHTPSRRWSDLVATKSGGSMRARLGFIPVGIVLALALMSAGAVATSSAASSPEFFAPRALDVECAISVETICISERPGYAQKATLSANGEVVLCTAHPSARGGSCEGNAGEHTPTLDYGRQIRRGSFRCVVLRTGVRCTVARTGKGFLISRSKVVPVGGASIVLASLSLREFLSPDRKVWCVVEDGVCGTNPEPPTRAAEIQSNGTVSLCFVPEVVYPPGGHVPLGCLQNFNQSAAILPYGQSDLYGDIRCTSTPNGITCVKVSGAGQGKGFRINANEAVEVGS